MDIEKLARECGAFKHAPFGVVEFIFEREALNCFAALVAEEAAKVCEDMRAKESAAAAHHAGFHAAFEYHLQRHAIIADVRDAIRERFKA